MAKLHPVLQAKLDEAGASHAHAEKRLLVLTFDQLPATSPRHISTQTAYEWLLEMDAPAARLSEATLKPPRGYPEAIW